MSRDRRPLAARRREEATTLIRRRRTLGALVVLAAAILTVLAYVKPNPLAETQTVRIAVSDAGGTDLVGGEVRMAGTPVGKVRDRERQGDGAVLTLEIERDVGTISRDARADVRPRTPFEGPVFIALTPGSPASPPLGVWVGNPSVGTATMGACRRSG